jgi:hypothetical protein
MYSVTAMTQLIVVFCPQEKAGFVPRLWRAEKNLEEPINVGIYSADAMPMLLGLPNFLSERFFRDRGSERRLIGR